MKAELLSLSNKNKSIFNGFGIIRKSTKLNRSFLLKDVVFNMEDLVIDLKCA